MPESDLAAAIRDRLVNLTPAAMAARAVLDKCEQMRAESGDRGVGHFIAAEFEQTIADALGITKES